MKPWLSLLLILNIGVLGAQEPPSLAGGVFVPEVYIHTGFPEVLGLDLGAGLIWGKESTHEGVYTRSTLGTDLKSWTWRHFFGWETGAGGLFVLRLGAGGGWNLDRQYPLAALEAQFRVVVLSLKVQLELPFLAPAVPGFTAEPRFLVNLGGGFF